MAACELPSSDAARRDAEPLSRWLNQHAAFMLAAAVATVWIPSGVWIAIAAAVSFVRLAVVLWPWRAMPFGGYANQLTALRLVILLAAASLITVLPNTWLWWLLLANVVADVADGYVARRTRQVSPFGAVFDREVDAVFVLVAYLYFFIEGVAAWVLLPGLLPYLYRLAVLLRRDRRAPEHRERLAPFLAGANFLLLLLAVRLPPELQLGAVLSSIALVGASFVISFIGLYAHEYSPS